MGWEQVTSTVVMYTDHQGQQMSRLEHPPWAKQLNLQFGSCHCDPTLQQYYLMQGCYVCDTNCEEVTRLCLSDHLYSESSVCVDS